MAAAQAILARALRLRAEDPLDPLMILYRLIVADAVEQAAVVFLQDAREALDNTDRRTQVMRDGVAEGRLFAEQVE